ncbi:MAG: MBL fold metallo-hydrolase [Bacillota bacterium]
MNSVMFLGTGGARIMLSTQLLATGGMLIKLDDTFFSLDPGPGALVSTVKYGFDPTSLDGIILSHRHLDHSADANVMIEAMTRGGLNKKGFLFAPLDALNNDPVIFKYLRHYAAGIIPLEPLTAYKINTLPFNTSMPHHHGNVETYGFIFKGKNTSVAYIPDTAFFPQLLEFYKADILIISMLRLEKSSIPHLSVADVEIILDALKPKLTLLTHFGLQVYNKGPENIAKDLAKKTGFIVKAALDGLKYEF